MRNDKIISHGKKQHWLIFLDKIYLQIRLHLQLKKQGFFGTNISMKNAKACETYTPKCMKSGEGVIV